MSFKKIVVGRRTIRQFTSDPVSDDDLREIISLATNACNSGNGQHWEFIAVRSDELKKQIADVVARKAESILDEVEEKSGFCRPSYSPQKFYLQAPVVLIVKTANGRFQSKTDFLMAKAGYDEDFVADLRARGDMQTIGAVVQLILLAAWEKGFGGCWMTGPLFARQELEQLLGISDGDILSAIIPIGKPAAMPIHSGRKPVDEVLKIIP